MKSNNSLWQTNEQERIAVLNPPFLGNPVHENKTVQSQGPPEEEDDNLDEEVIEEDDPFDEDEDDPFEISVPSEDEDHPSNTIDVDEHYPGPKESDFNQTGNDR